MQSTPKVPLSGVASSPELRLTRAVVLMFVIRDAETFTSTLTAVMWRPYNLTSLGSANINSTSTKDSSYGAATVFALVVTVSVAYGYQKGSLQLLWTGIGCCIAGITFILLPIVRMYARATKLLSASDAAFRGVHARFRLHSETIALYSAESMEAREMTSAYSGEQRSARVASCGVAFGANSFAAGVAAAQLRFIFWQAAFQGLQILFRFGPTVIALLLLKDELFKASKNESFPAARAALSTCCSI